MPEKSTISCYDTELGLHIPVHIVYRDRRSPAKTRTAGPCRGEQQAPQHMQADACLQTPRMDSQVEPTPFVGPDGERNHHAREKDSARAAR
jgi:hypothetical protein